MAVSGMQIYRNLYAEEKEMLNGVLAICVSKLATQPYITLATILSVSCLITVVFCLMFHPLVG